MDALSRIKEHYKNNWSAFSEYKLEKGLFNELPKEFTVLKFKPRKKRNMWTYATCGMSPEKDINKIELHIFSGKENDFLIELLAALTHYHNTGSKLNWGHSVNFGCPWAKDSNCSYGLISLPYLDGEKLENLYVGKLFVRFLWLIPITKEEFEYKKVNGLDALENLFEKNKLNYIDALRESIVK